MCTGDNVVQPNEEVVEEMRSAAVSAWVNNTTLEVMLIRRVLHLKHELEAVTHH